MKNIIGLVAFGIGNVFASMADERVVIEKRVYDEIDNLSITDAIQRQQKARMALQIMLRDNRRHLLPDDIIQNINGYVGYVREGGPSYDPMKIQEIVDYSWAIPLIPTILLTLKSLIHPSAMSSDTALVGGSVFVGALAQLFSLQYQSRRHRDNVVETSDALHDIAHGYRYYRYTLVDVLNSIPASVPRKRRITSESSLLECPKKRKKS